MYAINPYLELSYPLLEVTLWFGQTKHELSDLFDVQNQVFQRFEAFEHACQSQNLSVEDSQAVKYALTAFIDESALKSAQADVKTAWQTNPLQLEFFGEHMAGEGFFNKLTLLKQQAKADVLEIYFLCLQLGFKGIHGISSGEQLTAISLDLRAQLDALRSDNQTLLSIDAIPKEGIFKAMSKTVPAWIFSSVFVCLMFVFYFGFSFTMDGRINQSNQRINAYYQSHANVHFQKIIH